MLVKPALVVSVLFLASIFVAGCDNDKDQFSGLSDMVAERHQVRRAISDKAAKNGKGTPMDESMVAQDGDVKSGKMEKELASGTLFEKQIQIVDAQSNAPLAKGVAYLDKQGRIVRIKIIKK